MTTTISHRAKRPFFRGAKAVASIVIGALTIVTGAITLFSFLTDDSTNFTHLRIEAEPVSDGDKEWTIPVEALESSFPAPASGFPACGTEQLEWLNAHGTPLNRRFQVSARNSAKSGPSLALVDFRSSATPPETRGEPQIRVTCTSVEQLPETTYYARLDADRNDSTAREVTVKRGSGDRREQVPVVINLAPGESLQTRFELFSRFPASGKITAMVLNSEDERQIEVEGSTFEVPPLLFSGEMYLITDHTGLRCERVDGGSIDTCTLDQVRQEVANAQK